MQKDKEDRIPVNRPPLRYAGQSGDHQLTLLIMKGLVPGACLLTCMLTLMVVSFLIWLQLSGAVLLGVLAVSSILCAIVAIVIMVPGLRRFGDELLGRLGERVVGQALEELRASGYVIFHDIQASRSDAKAFNIDHVAVGPAGVLVFETKTWRKPKSGETKIVYDGKTITKNGGPPSDEQITQAKANARWIKDYVKDATLGEISGPITPILVFPGWYVDYEKGRDAEVKVTNDAMVLGLVRKLPQVMDEKTLKKLQYALRRQLEKDNEEILDPELYSRSL